MSLIAGKSCRKDRPVRASGKLAACALAFGLCAPDHAAAQVIEIGRDGTTVIYDQPAVITPDGATPIAARAPPRIATRAPEHIARSLDQAGSDVALSPLLLEAVAWAESRFNPLAVSSDGAQGVMQLMPGTAADLGVDAADPDANVRGGARYLRQMLELFDGNIELALAAYNAGPTAVRRHNGVPPYPETRAYVAAIMDYMANRTQPEKTP